MTAAFAPGETGTDQLLVAREGSLGRLRLNRPRAINALTHAMVQAMRVQLEAWAQDDSVTAVTLDGAGERGLCAGGDIRTIRESILAGDLGAALEFWADEYRLNALIHDYPKPYVALMTGVVMGGGVGVSAYGSLRLTTADARVAMPETAIGFFPDVGSLSLLSRAPGELGTHLAVTGTTIGGADAVHCGLADAVVSVDQLPTVLDQLALGEQVAASSVGDVAARGPLAASRDWIDACYAGDDPPAIVTRLRAHDAPEAGAAAELISTRSPTSVALTLEALRRAAQLSFEDVLAQDLALGHAIVCSPDFVEGVRAVLVDKDHAPRWQPARLEDVSRADVETIFAST